MATHDIRDYGAAVDGQTDDRQAVNDAISAAQSGDTVYFPTGTTLMSTDGADRCIYIDDGNSGVTLEGDGEGSVLKMAGGNTGFATIVRVDGSTGVTDFTIRNLALDGNRANNADNAVLLLMHPGGAENDVLFEDLWVYGSVGGGVGLQAAGGVARRITAYDNDGHGVFGDNETSVVDPRVEFHDILCHDNGGYGADASGGKTLIDGFVLHHNGWGAKSTVETIAAEFRNGMIRDNETLGYQHNATPSPAPTVTFDNVVSQDNGYTGFRFAGNADNQIGELLSLRNNSSNSSQGNIEVYDSASITATSIQSGDAVNGGGVFYDSSASSAVDTYVYDGNQDDGGGDGVTGTDSNFEVATSLNEPPQPLDVPTVDDVGAGSESSSDDGSGDGDETEPVADESGSVLQTSSGALQSTDGVIDTK